MGKKSTRMLWRTPVNVWNKGASAWSYGLRSLELSTQTPRHFMLFATTSKKGTDQGTMECSKSWSHQEKNRDIWDIGNETFGRPYVGTNSCWWSLEWNKQKNRRDTSMGKSSEFDFLRNKWKEMQLKGIEGTHKGWKERSKYNSSNVVSSGKLKSWFLQSIWGNKWSPEEPYKCWFCA